MFTYSPANTPIGQSELAYYVRYFIQRGNIIVGKPAVFIVAHKGKNLNWPAANQFAIYKCDREELNSGLPRPNPVSVVANSERSDYNSSALTACSCCVQIKLTCRRISGSSCWPCWSCYTFPWRILPNIPPSLVIRASPLKNVKLSTCILLSY